MNKIKFFDTMFVFSEDLNDLVLFTQEEIQNRTRLMLGNSGGFGKAYNYMSGSVPYAGILFSDPSVLFTGNSPLLVTKVSPTQVAINPGNAITSTGELIRVPSQQQISLGSTSWQPTPGVLNYVKLLYDSIKSDARVDDFGNTHFVREIDSYRIVINGIAPQQNEILLATFSAGSSGEIQGSITDRRMFARIITSADAVVIDPSLRPYPAMRTVEDHITAQGSAQSAGPTNPHRQKLNDLDSDCYTHMRGVYRTDFVLGFQEEDPPDHTEADLVFNVRYSQGKIKYTSGVFKHLAGNQLAQIETSGIKLKDHNVVFDKNHPVIAGPNSNADSYHRHSIVMPFTTVIYSAYQSNIKPELNIYYTNNYSKEGVYVPIFLTVGFTVTASSGPGGDMVLWIKTPNNIQFIANTVNIRGHSYDSGVTGNITAIIPPNHQYMLSFYPIQGSSVTIQEAAIIY